MNNSIKRGEIYYIRDTRQGVGSEQRADRPAVVVSNNKNNEYSGVIEVVYMTTQPKVDLPTHFKTTQALRPSTVLCEQIYSISVERVSEWIGTLTDDEMKELDYCIAVSVGLIEKNGIIEPLDEQAEEKRNRELGDLRQQLKEAIKIQQAAEKQATVFKEMYEFLLSKRMGA